MANPFTERLTALFATVEGEFLKVVKDNNRATAEIQHKGWHKLLEGDEPTGRFGWEASSRPKYVKFTGKIPIWGSEPRTWAEKQAAAKRGEYAPDIKKADEDAIFQVRQAKDHFIIKQTKKLTNATKRHGNVRPPTVTGTIKLRHLIEGTLLVQYDEQNWFSVEMSMVWNRSPLGKPFYQFPAKFTSATINGEPVTTRLSEKWMSENF